MGGGQYITAINYLRQQHLLVTSLGHVPERVCVGYSNGFLRTLGRRTDTRPLSLMELRDLTPVVGPAASNLVVMATEDSTSTHAGPLLGCATIYSTLKRHRGIEQDFALRNVNAGMSVRMRANLRFRPTASLRAKLLRYHQAALATLFSSTNIQRCIRRLPIFELMSQSLSAERVLRLVDDECARLHLPGRAANCKLEVTANPGKSPRVVFDEGLARTVANIAVYSLLEGVIFDDHTGFGPLSIKHVDKPNMMDRISKVLAEDHGDTCVVEVDQTKFEYHQRSGDGSTHGNFLDMEYEILKRVSSHVFVALNPVISEFYVQLEADATSGAHTFRCGFKPYLEAWNANLRSLIRISGNRGTSSMNFWVELESTLCAFCDNPERIFAPVATSLGLDPTPYGGPAGPLWLPADQGGFDYAFRCFTGHDLYLRPFVEGDDFVAASSRHVSAHRNFIVAQYREMGLDAKLKIVVEGRAEFVGVHFPVTNGRGTPGYWCPDVARTLITSGVSVTRAPNVAAAITAKYFSYAVMYGPTVWAVAMYFKSLAYDWLARTSIDAVVDLDFPLRNIFGHTRQAKLGDIADHAEQAIESNSFTLSQQRELLSASLERDVTPAEYGRFLAMSTDISRDTDPELVLSCLPAALSDTILRSFLN